MTYHYKRGSPRAPLPITEKFETPHQEVWNPSPRGRERIAERVSYDIAYCACSCSCLLSVLEGRKATWSERMFFALTSSLLISPPFERNVVRNVPSEPSFTIPPLCNFSAMASSKAQRAVSTSAWVKVVDSLMRSQSLSRVIVPL